MAVNNQSNAKKELLKYKLKRPGTKNSLIKPKTKRAVKK